MTGRVQGKVALITGAGRGQGRSHAIRLAEEGADIIAVDICKDVDSVPYPLASEADMAETVRAVESLRRRIVAITADVRERSQLAAALEAGVSSLGRLDVVVANAGVAPIGAAVPLQGWFDTVSINLSGVINTVACAYPYLEPGASIICIGSIAALMPGGGTDNPALGPGSAGYTHAKHGVARFVHDLALQLAPHSIRVNAVHPTNVDTPMLHNQDLYRIFRPDLANPSREEAEVGFLAQQPMPVPYIAPRDVSNAVLYLASEESCYVTGLQLKVDAGAMLSRSASGAPA